ncbi:hypothetical protein F5X68DRAFT_275777 [Plectosphaerella plurivora]|uniref:Uncharacterized protein n=1 Tax=Plectosphaerella plurivora TaxID=936078 RepID=A0A9P8VCJ0_9PEZI|nr:hypothetical protein F5X68DRAFT_275777 [Plectosphaerella plurivora]
MSDADGNANNTEIIGDGTTGANRTDDGAKDELTEASGLASLPSDAAATSSMTGITTGQAVGIGFGSAIGGVFLLLAVGLFFHFIRKGNLSRKRRPQPVPPDSAALDLLEQPLAHETIRKDMRSLQTGIKNFVDNYFRFEKVILDAAGEAQIQALAGRPSQDSKSSWSDALGDPSLQPLMTRAIISRALFAMIDPKYDGNITLLPPDLKGAYQSLHDTGPSSRRSIDVHQRTRLLSLWRRISGHLLSPSERPDQNQVEGVADEIAAALAPLRHQKSGNYHAVLRTLVASAAKLGMNLFEQPHEWRALWSTSHSGKRGVAVFPGLSFITEVQPSDKGHGFEAVNSMRVCKVVIEE